MFYSSSLKSGILQFRQFLDYYGIEYLYLDVDISDNKKKRILDQFKSSSVFLLLHPLYTEGISIYKAEAGYV